jgi:guanylate kinase
MSKLIVIVAPSGTGKSTLIEKLQSEVKGLKWSISHTTRPMREGEVHGQNYFFVNRSDFEKGIAEGKFAEWFEVHSNFYGTSKEFINAGLSSNEFLLFDLDVQGAKEIKHLYGGDAQTIFIEPPSIEALEKRLKARATDAEEVIQERLNNAKAELAQKDDFDYCVLNDDFDQAYTDFKKVVTEIMGKK